MRLANDQTSTYDKFSALGIRLTHFRRLLSQLPDNQLTSLHLHLTDMTTQDTRAIEALFQTLSDTIELQQRSLKELTFNGASFDLNSNSEKDFYTSMSFPNLKRLVLTNCKFVCYDSFERFFANLADTENSIEYLEITRLNSSCSAKGFKQFLQSQ